MTNADFETFWNDSLTYIWEQINWIDERLEENPNPKKAKELEEIMRRLKAVMKLKKQ